MLKAHVPPSTVLCWMTRIAWPKAEGSGACLQVYLEGENAVLLDHVGDGRALHLQGAPGHHGRWRYAVERHRPLIGRMDEEVA